MQAAVFRKKGERSQNVKKMLIDGSHYVHALFTSEDEFHGPIFKTMKDAGNYMANSKTILIPCKEKKKTYMALQLIFNVNMKAQSFQQ